MSTLTPDEQRIWDFIADRLCVGSAPTIREIVARCAFRSTNAVHRRLKTMASKGFLIRKTRTSRGLQTIDPTAPPKRITAMIPVYGSIPAGSPNECTQAAEDYLNIDLGMLSLPTSSSRFFALRVRGDSMIGAGILDGDLAILDPNKAAHSGNIVAAYVDGKSTIKRLLWKKGKVHLKAENPRYAEITPQENLSIQGVVIGLCRKV